MLKSLKLLISFSTGKLHILEAKVERGGRETWRKSSCYSPESNLHRLASVTLLGGSTTLHLHLSLQLSVCPTCPDLRQIGQSLAPCCSPSVSQGQGQFI